MSRGNEKRPGPVREMQGNWDLDGSKFTER